MEARISSADLVQRNGLGSALCFSMKLVIAVNAAPDLPLGEEREEAFDLIPLGNPYAGLVQLTDWRA
jgi:hypothetical protein